MSTTGQQIVNDIRSMIVEPYPTFFSDARMLTLINKAQRSYVRLTKVLEAKAYTQTITNQMGYVAPADYLSSLSVFYNNQRMVNGSPVDGWYKILPYSIEKISQEIINFLNSSTPTNIQIPTRWYMIEKQIYLWPTPTVGDVANNLCMIYERFPAVLTSLSQNLSIDDSLTEGIVAFVLWQAYSQDGEDAKAKQWEDIWNIEVGRGRTWKRQRMLDARTALDVDSYLPSTYGNFPPITNGTINPMSF